MIYNKYLLNIILLVLLLYIFLFKQLISKLLGLQSPSYISDNNKLI